jgi:hypothetical protein
MATSKAASCENQAEVETMANRRACFDKLPDELIADILCRFAMEYDEETQQWHPFSVKRVFTAQAVCRRWQKLTYMVESLYWPVSTVESAAAMGRFLLCEHQAIKALTIEVSGESDGKDMQLPFNLILGIIRNRLPPSVEIFIGWNITLEKGVEELFYSSSIRRLSVESLYAFDRHKLPRAPRISSSQITHLNLRGIDVPGESLQSILSSCPSLEVLSWDHWNHGTDAVFSPILW